MKQIFSFFFLLLLCKSMMAQMPDTDIWLFDLQQKGDSFKLGNGINFTNRPGYDNQPSFSPDNKSIYYTSYWDGQSDIYRYDIPSKTTKQFTATPESEYSPNVTPDGNFVSVVSVEKDSAQRLWKFPLKGGPPVLVFKNLDSIGYYCWLNESGLYLFILGNPERVIEVSTKADSKKKELIRMTKGGRSLHPYEIVSKQDSVHWYISHYLDGPESPTTPLFSPIIETIKGREDYAMTSHITLIRKDTPLNNPDSHVVYEFNYFMGNGHLLYKYTVTNAALIKPVGADHWKLVADLSGNGIKNIGRIAISPDGKKIAIVSTP
ncbi:MAG: TolB family protein [Bacteroidia bacterium]